MLLVLLVESLDFFGFLVVLEAPFVPLVPLAVVPLVEPLVPLAVVPLVDGVAVADEVADWSPVVAEVPLLRDWSPVVAEVLLLSDWLPVVVLLSIVTLERPRRSIVGLTVELEPLSDVFESAVLPVTDELLLEVEPVTDGEDEALVPLVPLVPAAPLVPLVPLMPLAELPRVLEELPSVLEEPELPSVLDEPAAAASLSGMQSMWTGLAECSFALPVSLSASLPAFGWFRLLHSGLLDVAAVVVADGLVALVLLDGLVADVLADGLVMVLLDVDCAYASGVRAAMTAEAMSDRVRFCFMVVYLLLRLEIQKQGGPKRPA